MSWTGTRWIGAQSRTTYGGYDNGSSRRRRRGICEADRRPAGGRPEIHCRPLWFFRLSSLDIRPPYFAPAPRSTVTPVAHIVDTGSTPHDIVHYLPEPTAGRIVTETLTVG